MAIRYARWVLRSAARLAVLVAGGALGAACSLLVATDGYTGGPPKEAGVGPTDATSADNGADGDAASDAADGDADSGADAPNLFTNGDFELGCAGWEAEQGTLADETTTVHSGSRACRVCTATGGAVVVRQQLEVAVAAGETFFAEAYVRAVPGDAGVTSAPTQASIATYESGVAVEASPSTGPALDGTWRPLSAVLRTTRPATTLVVRFQTTSGGGCLLVDDARLTRP